MAQPAFTVSELWKFANTCSCLGTLVFVNRTCWEKGQPQTKVRCDDCQAVYLITHYRELITKGCATKEQTETTEVSS